MSSLIAGAKAWAVIPIVLLLVGLAAGYFIGVQQPKTLLHAFSHGRVLLF